MGDVSLVTGPPVLFEFAWTLKSAYGQPNEKDLDVLTATVALPGLQLTDSRTVEKAVALARKTGREFADACIAASAEAAEADALATFNRRHFETLGASLHGF